MAANEKSGQTANSEASAAPSADKPCGGPATEKSSNHKIDQKSGSSGPVFALKSAQKRAGPQPLFRPFFGADIKAKTDPEEPLF